MNLFFGKMVDVDLDPSVRQLNFLPASSFAPVNFVYKGNLPLFTLLLYNFSIFPSYVNKKILNNPRITKL